MSLYENLESKLFRGLKQVLWKEEKEKRYGVVRLNVVQLEKPNINV